MTLRYAPNKILVALDGSAPARFALAYAAGLAARAGTARMIAIQVRRSLREMPAVPGSGPAAADLLKEQPRRDLGLREAMTADVAPYAARFEWEIALAEGRGGKTLADEAERRGAHLVVVGSRGVTGAARVLLGSFAEAVARHSKVPVLIIRQPTGGSPEAPDKAPPPFPPARVLAATDFSEPAAAGVEYASMMAEAWGVGFEVVHAVRPEVGAAGAAERAHAEEMRRLRRYGDVPLHIEVGDAAERISARAGDGRGALIVLSSKGRTGAARMLLGSVAEKTARIAPCPVLIVK